MYGSRSSLTARALQPVMAGLEALGHPARTLLADAGIPPSIRDDPDQRLPNGSMGRLWKHAVASTGDDCLGMHVAMAAPIGSFDIHGYAMLSSPTLRDAYQRVSRLQRLVNEATELTFAEGPSMAVLRHGTAAGGAVSRQPAEFLVTSWLRLGRIVAGSRWAPTVVFFAHDQPTDTREHSSVLDAPLQFASGQTAMHIPVAVLDRTNLRADPTLVALLDRYSATLLERRAVPTSISMRVRAWLVEAHGTGTPLARHAARTLGMSERTLHRRLTEEQTTFRGLLEQFRREQAVALLTSGRCNIAQTAFLLGYSELSAFYRAFHRWTGKSPAALRAEIRTPPAR